MGSHKAQLHYSYDLSRGDEYGHKYKTRLKYSDHDNRGIYSFQKKKVQRRDYETNQRDLSRTHEAAQEEI